MIATIVVTALLTTLAVVLAMNFMRSDKQLEHKILHHYSVDDPQFKREMSVLLGPTILPGNHVTDLQNGEEIFPAMLEAIKAARRCIALETYIYWSGDIGERFAEALSERARNGVTVNLTIDWAGSIKMEDDLLDEMKHAGVRIELYRPLRWYTLNRLNNRTHRKLLIVDGRIGFTGGVGIADQWLGAAQDPEHWRDAHYRVEGPVVAQMQAAFIDNWIKMTGEVLNGDDDFPALEPAGDMDAQLFVSSPSGGSESMHLMYLMTIAAAEHTIDLAASYFVPDPLVVKALIAARERGVAIRVMLPGEHIDSEAVRLAKATWGELLQAGVEIHVFQPTMTHTKLLVVDRQLVSVGSTNFDLRSFRLNDEASLNVYDRAFAARMTEVFESDLKRAERYSYEQWKARPWHQKLAEKFIIPIRSQL